MAEKVAWTTFGTAEKAWAYTQDQLSSTHPIAADIPELEKIGVAKVFTPGATTTDIVAWVRGAVTSD